MTSNYQFNNVEMQQLSALSLQHKQEIDGEHELHHLPNDSSVNVTERTEMTLKKQTSKRWLCVLCFTSGSIILLNIIYNIVSNESLVAQMMSLLQKKNSTCDHWWWLHKVKPSRRKNVYIYLTVSLVEQIQFKLKCLMGEISPSVPPLCRFTSTL